MKSLNRYMFLILCFAAIVILLNYTTNLPKKLYDAGNKRIAILSTSAKSSQVTGRMDEVVICVVACGDRLEESLTMLKSALVFTNRPLRFIVIADGNLITAFDEKLTEWQYKTNKTFNFILKPVTFPENSDVSMWKKLFKPCAAQRLFLPVRFSLLKKKHISPVLITLYTLIIPYTRYYRANNATLLNILYTVIHCLYTRANVTEFNSSFFLLLRVMPDFILEVLSVFTY